jgi:predicted Fe-Mo cluster-binding NifX family protein
VVKVAVSSQGTSLDAWAGGPFGLCAQFLVVDTETLEYVVVSVPPEQLDASQVSVPAIRGIAAQGAEVVLTGMIKDVCQEAMETLGMEVISGIQRMTVRQAVEMYRTSGQQALAQYQPPSVKIAVASHGESLEAPLGPEGEPCTSFVLVDPASWTFEVIRVPPADSNERASVNAVRAAARSGATVVITPEIRPACCTALRTLAITVALADPGSTVREAVNQYLAGELESPPYL